MQKYISADWIFPVTSSPLKNGVIAYGDDGVISAIFTADEAKNQSITAVDHFRGAIIPGLINTHCHLELSHLYRKIPQKTGLTGFIKQILALRQQPDEEILEAMENADAEMYHNGIVAIGDIANKLISKEVKEKSKLYYHTFIEVFGFNRPSKPVIEEGKRLKQSFFPLKSSIVPHAPYSVIPELFAEILNCTSADDILSIHNQETDSENKLFIEGNGPFAEFLTGANIALAAHHGSGKNSINYHLPQLKNDVNTLLVHNTFSDENDIAFAGSSHQKLYWCLCPKANLYIENALPNVQLLQNAGVKITLGTDSLASNTGLNILAEMQVLQSQKNIGFEELLKWATLNGAEFLGIADNYGSLEVGKKPGLVLVDLQEDWLLKDNTEITRLV
jgi:cytosine/adenosine deaminase-related metal-dependent hydrolase